MEKAIVLALRDLGGSASRKDLRKAIADRGYDGLSYDQVFATKQGKSGTYSPFMFDFNFGIRNLGSEIYHLFTKAVRAISSPLFGFSTYPTLTKLRIPKLKSNMNGE
ncbi:hypothetical protein ACW185_10590 [Limosilactobacillus fermentum]